MDKKKPIEIDKTKAYGLAEATELLSKVSTSKFVGSVDIDIVLKQKKKKNQETIRGNISFPHQFTEGKKVIVFADEQNAKIALKAGAVAAGLEELIPQIEKGTLEFDIVLATPDVMVQIAKLGRFLGPKGLMPNPSNGTLTTNVEKTVAEYISGKQNYKMSDQNVIRSRVAKLNLKPEQIAENIVAFLRAVMTEARRIDQQPFKKITISPTMGAGLRLNVAELVEML
jgi:large subunit ribosomal protein L1